MTSQSQHAISEITRRSIADSISLERINWAGRFGEDGFLGRLHDLQSLPSTDRRYASAAEDIWKHRTMNRDWEDDWVFYDSRFALLHASDEEFLRFLCEALHPVVQPDPEEVERIREVFNCFLLPDGWEIREQMRVSGRPVYAAFAALEADFHTSTAGKSEETVRRLLSNLATVSDSMAQLRNLHGTGHGKEADTVGLEFRHARLAVGTATALGVFLLESYRDNAGAGKRRG